MRLRFFLYNLLVQLKTKTAYHTHFLTSKALHQQPDAVAVPPSRGSTFSRQRTQRELTSPSDKSSNTHESEHLPPIIPPPATAFRHHLPNGTNSTHGFQLNNNHNNSSPTSDKKYFPKTMNTTTTVKKTLGGGPVISNGTPVRSTRTNSRESSNRVKFKCFDF